jgi:nucleotide-binding universal stress UspA family protein
MRVLIAHDGQEHSEAAILDLRRAGLPGVVEAVVLSVAEGRVESADGGFGVLTAGPAMPLLESQAREPSGGGGPREAEQYAARAAARLRENFPGWHVMTEACVDSPAAAIIRKAHAWKPDLIVVGSHGWTGVRRLVLGSVSLKVLHHVDGAVRISRRHLHAQDRPIRLVLGVDGSKDAEAAIRSAGARMWPAGTEARVVGVVDRQTLRSNPITMTPEAVPAAVEENWRTHLSMKIREAAMKLQRAGLAAAGKVLDGKPCEVLIEEAEKWEADCVFVGARGLNVVERMLLGSVSSDVAARAHCSVEIVRERMA